MIYDQLRTPKHEFTPHGSRYLNVYQEEINKKTGSKELVKTGETNIYEMIQQDAEACKIENILKAVAMGDLSALKQREATYVDATTMPKNLMEAQNLVIRMKDEFYKMPVEVRKEFGNDPDRYVSLMGTKEFKEIMAPYNDKIAAIAKEESDAAYRAKISNDAKYKLDLEAELASQKGATE